MTEAVNQASQVNSQTKTPWHVWLVGALAVLWNGFGAFDFTASATRFEPYIANFPQALLDYLYALPPWLWALWALGVFGGLIGAVLLLLRNKNAVWAFAASLVGAVVSIGAGFVDPPPPEAGGSQAFGYIIIAIAAALLGYAFWLSRRGVLR